MDDLPRSIRRTTHWLVGGAAGLLLLVLLLSAGAASAVRGIATLPPAPGSRPETLTHTAYLPFVTRDHYLGPSMFGIELPGMDLSQPGAVLNLTTDAHMYWARWRLPWYYIEPISTTPPTYGWQYYDPSITAAARQGLHLILTIDYNPPWAALYRSGPISLTATTRFTDFVRSTVERYDGDGNADAPGSPVVNDWEFYNEPDGGNLGEARNGTGSYWGKNPDTYAQMLCSIYPVVKAANPQAQVLFGGVAHDLFDDEGDPPGPFVRSFIDDVLARIQAISPAQPCFDTMNFHYYPFFRFVWDPTGTGGGLVAKMNHIRGILQAHNMGSVPIAVTELGWHSNALPPLPNGQPHPATSSPEMQADYVLEGYAEALAAKPALGIWFSWLDPGLGFDNGLLYPPDAQHPLPWPKPAYTAYATAAYRLEGARDVRMLTVADLGSSHLEGYLVTPAPTAGARHEYVLWSNDAYTSTSTYPVSLPAGYARAVAVDGTAGPIIRDADDGHADGRVTVTASVHPIYVEVWP